MHELSIAAAILDAVRDETVAESGKPIEVGIRLGAFSGIDRDALEFGFSALTTDSDLDGLRLAVEEVPHRRRCKGCNKEFEVATLMVGCPHCGSPCTEFLDGDEMVITYVELEEK